MGAVVDVGIGMEFVGMLDGGVGCRFVGAVVHMGIGMKFL